MLLILIGPSGSGKSSIEKKLEESGIYRLQSYTTRPRKAEEGGNAYHFVTKEEFRKIKMAESILYKNHYFGLSVDELQKSNVMDCVVTLTWNGAEQVKRFAPSAVTVYLDCPMYQLEKRIPELSDPSRREKILAQIEEDARCATDCDYIVRNHDNQMDEALAEIKKIFDTHKNASQIG